MNSNLNSKNIQNKTAVIIGGSEGIGFGCAKSLTSCAHNIVIFSRNKSKLLTARKELEKFNVNIITIVGSIASKRDMDRLFLELKQLNLSCDILVINNSGPLPGSMLDLNEEDWHDVFESHVIPFFRVIKTVIPDMKKNKWGRIITIGSISAKEPIEDLDLSNFIRAGFAAVNKTLSKKVASDNICTHFICPGSIMTNRSKKIIENRSKKMNISFEESVDLSKSRIPMGRLGKPEEVGELVAFLCSQKANYMTGNVIQIDGGLSNGII